MLVDTKRSGMLQGYDGDDERQCGRVMMIMRQLLFLLPPCRYMRVTYRRAWLMMRLEEGQNGIPLVV